MKKLLLILTLALILCFMVGCQKEAKVERFMEDGVKVIVNHLEPYKIKGESFSLQIEELFTIDTENDEIAKIGLTDIAAFDVDSEGSIYLFQNQVQTKNLVYKFDENANFVTSFGKIGQGPGEMSIPILLPITKKDEIRIKDNRKPLLSFFDKNGNLIKEIRITILEPGGIGRFTFISLENGNYLVQENFTNPTTRQRFRFLYLVDSKFEKLKTLDEMDTGLSRQFAEKIKVTSNFLYKVSNEMIYAGNENRGYEILIFNLNGKLLRKIRKEYIPVDAP
ncbi:MAG: 6-bladed beta-propeller, partial [Candidatus Thorarchaeota archaeon]